MADQTDPWDTAVADTTTQTAVARGTPAGVATEDGGSTDWLNARRGTPVCLLDPFHKTNIAGWHGCESGGVPQPCTFRFSVPVDYIVTAFSNCWVAPGGRCILCADYWQVSGVGHGIATAYRL
ncbi:hypothetical protein KCP71_12505 [Salmonella enterica subsp. enterica]|nr:hypothetical protein KCP71_12505 [Salmonella enterica subsp. enterica]